MTWSGVQWMVRHGLLRRTEEPVRQAPASAAGVKMAPSLMLPKKTMAGSMTDQGTDQGKSTEQPASVNPVASPTVLSQSEDGDVTPKIVPNARIVVVGNQKGGSGKSTTTMHLIAGLMASGARVACIDLDARQGTLSRYIENRQAYIDRTGRQLPMPTHRSIEPSGVASVDVARAHDAHAVEKAVQDLSARHDFVVIDTPGTDNFLSRVGHSYSDTLVTPLNDSFVDLDVLAVVDPESHAMVKPSKYAEMVFQVKMQKARREKSNRTFDWVVMRNRTGQLDSRNQRAMEEALSKLSDRIGFRVVPGFSERVIFRELFLDGLTLLDLRSRGSEMRMNMSHLAARQEVRDLMAAINLKKLDPSES